jgi:hypothetical protein
MKRSTINFLAASIGIYGWVISLLSIFKTGLGWDSVFDLNAAKISFENFRILNLTTYYDLVPLTSEFYGTLVYRIANWVSILVTDRSIFDNPSLLTNLYFVDLTTWFLALLSILVVCFSLYITFQSKSYAFLYFGMISTLPIWVGMSQVNSKDIPVAAGLSILSSGFMLIFKYSTQRLYFYLGIFLTSLGSGISISVRPASISIVLSFLFLNSVILLLIKFRDLKWTSRFKNIFKLNFITSTISLLILYFSNNIHLLNLYTWIIDAVKVSLNFPSVQPIRLLGQDFLSNELPPWYVLAWVWAQLPLLTFLSLILSLILILKQLFVQKRLQLAHPIIPFFIQAFFVPLVIFFTQANLYNGIRHILFIYPALILLAIIFLDRLLSYSKNRQPNLLASITVILILFFNVFSTYRWLPYSYAYINPLAGIGNQRNWDLDYWGLSSREGIDRLNKLGFSKNIIVMPDNSSSIPFGGKNVSQILVTDSPINLYVYIHWNHKILSDNCLIDFQIKRDNQVLGMGGRCSKLGN